jgi:hypothetical protein
MNLDRNSADGADRTSLPGYKTEVLLENLDDFLERSAFCNVKAFDVALLYFPFISRVSARFGFVGVEC